MAYTSIMCAKAREEGSVWSRRGPHLLPSGVIGQSLRYTKADSPDYTYSYMAHPGCERTLLPLWDVKERACPYVMWL